MKSEYVWLITANNLPVEIHENRHTADSVVSKWSRNTSSNIQLYKVPLYKSLKTVL